MPFRIRNKWDLLCYRKVNLTYLCLPKPLQITVTVTDTMVTVWLGLGTKTSG